MVVDAGMRDQKGSGPHCTLAIECPPTTVPRVVEVCGVLRLPLDGQLDGVVIVEFRPIHHLPAFRFAERPGGR